MRGVSFLGMGLGKEGVVSVRRMRVTGMKRGVRRAKQGGWVYSIRGEEMLGTNLCAPVPCDFSFDDEFVVWGILETLVVAPGK